jgi:2-haloacid dehalogenase
MPEPVRHIVFDIGKVLIHYDPEIPFARLIPDPDRRRWFFENVCTPAWNIEQDRGRPWEEAEALLIGKFPEEEANIRAFRRHWHEMVPHAYEDTVAIMEMLIDRGHDVTMLTNFAADTLVEARERFAFLSRSRGVTVSGEVLLLKPQREIYEHHARQFGLAPAHTLFIDDSASNVQGAIDAGWQAIRFVDATTLTRDLAARGIAAA